MKLGLPRVFGGFVTIIFFVALKLFAQGTAFTYQGRLNDSGAPANGTYDLRFTVYDSTNLPGVVIAGPLTNSGTIISNGLFMVALDFGAGVFTGPDRWLEIAVRTNGAAAFSTLPARQLVTPTPYAINAANLGGALHVDANNTNGAPNIIGGSPLNQVDPGVVGAVIAGGGATNYFGNAFSNRVAGNFSAIGGGINNLNLSVGSVIAGGVRNQIQPGGSYDSIGGGILNLIEASTDQSFIGGGYGNDVHSFARSSFIGGGELNTNGAPYSVIAGGQNNVIEFTSDSSGIAGGSGNAIRSNSLAAFIGGGAGNRIGTNSSYATIGGGVNNSIQSNAPFAVIVGGHDSLIQSAAYTFMGAGGLHQILSNAYDSAIVAGGYNMIQPNANGSFIGGGYGHIIQTNAGAAVIVGGNNNVVGPYSSYAAIVGGYFNTIDYNAYTSFIGGGYYNVIGTNSFAAAISAGHSNVIDTGSAFTFIGAGGFNEIQTNSTDSAIVAGGYNFIGPNSPGSFVGGGYSNLILTNSGSSVIGGGGQNSIQSNSPYAFIGGGEYNTIQWNDFYATIGGGGGNTIQTNSPYATIAGGIDNTIQTNSSSSTIGGGYFNIIQSNAFYSTIPGGDFNLVAAPYAFAAGQEAQALHRGSFVWADSQFASFASTTSNQFNVRATGGVRFVTTGAGITLDGQPILTTGSGAMGFSILQNGSGAPDVIEGAPNNFVAPGIVGATVGGGGATNYLGASYSNSATGNFATVSGGVGNTASGAGSFVGGGGFDGTFLLGNFASGAASVVAGGLSNGVTGDYATVGGGGYNSAGGLAATVGGGAQNTASAQTSTVGGGGNNYAGAEGATVSGGYYNTNKGIYATVGGGNQNFASGKDATVGGGLINQATNFYATVPGGYANIAGGIGSFAAGEQAQALHQGSFVWADSENASFSSTVSNQFSVRAGNGFRVSDGTNGNIVMQDLHGNNGDGYQSLNFNGYYDQFAGTEQRFNAAKTRWRLVVDQRNATDLMTIDNFNGTTVSNLVAITTGGNVGIGTNTPSQLLQLGVTAGHGEGMEIDSAVAGDSPAIYLNHNGSLGRKFRIASYGDNATAGSLRIRDETAGVYRITMDSAGNVGIGTTIPDNLLTVNGSADKPGGGSWGTFSDARLKNIGENFTNGIESLEAIQPVHYHYKSDNALNLPAQPEYIGVVAQEVERTVPEAVEHSKTGYLVVNNDPIFWTTVNAVKTLNRNLAAKETEIRELKEKNDSLEKRLTALEAILRNQK